MVHLLALPDAALKSEVEDRSFQCLFSIPIQQWELFPFVSVRQMVHLLALPDSEAEDHSFQ